MTETWRPVPLREFANYYDVSNLGRVRRTKPGGGSRVGYILKEREGRNGYLIVRLSQPRCARTVTVHRLVALAFLGPRPHGHEVNHIDHDRANNAASNLEWVTPAENTVHKMRANRQRAPLGEAHGMSRLTEEQVKRILRSPRPVREIAAQFGVGVSTVYDIKRRVTWTHVHVDDFCPLKGRKWRERGQIAQVGIGSRP